MRLPPAVMFKTPATSSMQFTLTYLGEGIVKDFKETTTQLLQLF
jgi:hypothetical protein